MTAYGPTPENYLRWHRRRSPTADDVEIINGLIAAYSSPAPLFQVILRTDTAQHPGIAQTVQGLRQQLHRQWRVDVFCRAGAAPVETGADPALHWHFVDHAPDMRTAIDAVVAECGADWVVELAPGTVPAPLCLFHVAHRADLARRQGALRRAAVYADDDVLGADGTRAAPRLKPDFDPDWMRSCDLTGPLFVATWAWHSAGGASALDQCPWFDLMLRLVEAGHGERIDHVDEPLLSLPPPADPERVSLQCRTALAQHLRRIEEQAEVLPVAPGTWRIRRARRATPKVTIAIPSRDRPEILAACIDAVTRHTDYPDYEILVIDGQSHEHDTHRLYAQLSASSEIPVRIVVQEGAWSCASFANRAAASASGAYLLLLADDIRIVSNDWLDELMAHALRDDVAAVAPRIARAPDGLIESAGYVLGMGGVFGTPHPLEATLADGGYLDCLQVDRRVPALPAACLLVERERFLSCGGMDEAAFAAGHADLDFCLRLSHTTGRACLVCAAVTVARTVGSALEPFAATPLEQARRVAARTEAEDRLFAKWFAHFFTTTFWSRHFGCLDDATRLNTRFAPPWAALPAPLPRFAVFPERGAQGHYRVARPLAALRRARKALACEYDTSVSDETVVPTHALARFKPDAVIAHLATHERSIAMLAEIRRFMPETFLVFACDDLVTDIPPHVAASRSIPHDMRTRLSRALASCHRLVVSTPYLAEAFRHYIDDIRIVPNRLEKSAWLSLQSRRGTGPRPRVGWAGGVTHEADLVLIEQVLAATADEFDWVFLGMCPRPLRKYVREYHALVDIGSYPAYLAGLNLDLAVAPLERNPFNRARSNLRLLEYGALAIPVVCSDIDPYRDTPACRVANEPQAWLTALRERAYDPDSASREGQVLKEWVMADYLLEDHLDDWLDAHLPS